MGTTKNDYPEMLIPMSIEAAAGISHGHEGYLYCYHVQRDGKDEIRSINEFHMAQHYGGQSGLEAFLRARCTTVEFLGSVRFKLDPSRRTVTFPTDQPGVLEFLRRAGSLASNGTKVAPFFEEGTSWLDGDRPS